MTALTADSLRWQLLAVCRAGDLDLFFGPDGERSDERDLREQRAKQVCAGCPVRVPCLDWALIPATQYGVAGGMGEDERRRYRAAERSSRRRRAAA